MKRFRVWCQSANVCGWKGYRTAKSLYYATENRCPRCGSWDLVGRPVEKRTVGDIA